MKKIIFALTTLTALSTASFAERSWDLRNRLRHKVHSARLQIAHVRMTRCSLM